MGGEAQIKRLQKICRYGSYIIAVILGFLTIVTAIMFIAMALSPEIRNELFDDNLVGLNALIVFSITVIITILTLAVVYKLMSAISTDRTPFTIQNVKYIKSIAILLLLLGITITIFNVLFNIASEVNDDASIEITPILAAIVVYCISLVFQYGVVLQEESDQTL